MLNRVQKIVTELAGLTDKAGIATQAMQSSGMSAEQSRSAMDWMLQSTKSECDGGNQPVIYRDCSDLRFCGMHDLVYTRTEKGCGYIRSALNTSWRINIR